jgi:hypothetical protein
VLPRGHVGQLIPGREPVLGTNPARARPLSESPTIHPEHPPTLPGQAQKSTRHRQNIYEIVARNYFRVADPQR